MAAPVFLAVGRFVDKKAPHLTMTAFAKSLRDQPEARLRMIGEGPRLPACRELAVELGAEHAIVFLGAQPHEVVDDILNPAPYGYEQSDGTCLVPRWNITIFSGKLYDVAHGKGVPGTKDRKDRTRKRPPIASRKADGVSATDPYAHQKRPE